MAKLLSPEEYEATFGGGRRAEAPQAGRSNLFGSAVDRTQAALLGIGEEYGGPFAEEARRRNQFEAEETARRYYETNPDRIRSFREIRGIGDVGSYAADLGVQTAPALIGLGASSLAGGVPGALAFGTALGKGEILQAQREEAGRTDLLSATAGGLAYGAADALTGIGGAVVRRSLGTGIGSLDRLGTRALDDISGVKGVAARSAVAGGKSAVTEGIGETLQQGTVIGGRMAVNPDLQFFSPENISELQESAFAGTLLGFGVGSFGGRRTSIQRDEPVNLLSDTPAAPAAQPRVSAEQINQAMGLGQPSRNAKEYVKSFEQAFNEPSGQFVADPETGIERELTMGEYYQRSSGTLDLTQDKPAQTAVATAAAAQTLRDPRALFLRDTLGVVPTASALQLISAIEQAGIPLDSDIASPVITFAAQRPMGKKQLDRALQMLDEAVINSRRAAAPVVSEVPGVPKPAGVLPTAAPAVVGLSRGGQVAPTATQAPVAPAAAPVAPTAAAQISQAPSAPATPAPVIQQGTPSGITTPQAQQTETQGQAAPAAAAAGITPAPTVDRLADVMGLSEEEQNRLDIAAMTGQQDLASTLEDEATGQRVDEETATENQIEAALTARFAKSRNPARDRQILEAYLAATRGSAQGVSETVIQALATQYGVTAAAIRKIGNTETLVSSGQAAGLTRGQVLDAFDIADRSKTRKPETAERAEREQEAEAERAVNDPNVFGAGLAAQGLSPDAGFVEDSSRFWQEESSKGNPAADAFFKLDAQLKDAQRIVDTLAAQGPSVALDAATAQVQALTAQLTGRVEAAKVDIEEKKAKKGEAKPEKGELSAQEKALREKLVAEADAKRKAERKGLEVGDTVVNPKLGTGVIEKFAGNGDATTATIKFQNGQTRELSVKLAPLEKINAVQKPSAAGVPVQPKTEVGQKVGRQVRRAEKPAAEGQAKTEAKVLTTQERYAEVTAGIPGAPTFDSLTKAQQDQLADLNNNGNLNLAAVNTLLSDGKFGMDVPARKPYTAKELLAEIKAFIRADIPGRKLLVVDSIQDLLNSPDRDVQIAGAGIALNQAYGVAANGRAYLIANRINKGSGRAKFMHEVGAHLGLENLLSQKSYDKLTQQILDWAKKDDGSIEAELANAAAARVMAAGTPKEDQRSELLAYFIEEAMESGIDPTAAGKESGPLRDWFRTLWAAFKTAARALGVKPESMTSQDVVNLAFGAARLEIAGTWHGTAASFRNFSNKFIGSGEGAQAFGWGTYIAQRAGIAKGYWKADVERKLVSDPKAARYDGKPNAALTRAVQNQGLGLRNYGVKWMLDREAEQLDNLAPWEDNPKLAEGLRRMAAELRAMDPDKVVLGPEGSLMRVDVSVPENEMLDWDTPLSEQPSVLTKIESNLSEDLREAVEEEVNESIGFMTGEDFYRALTFIEKRDGFVSEQFDVEDYNKRLANTPAKQVVSTFIDEKLGINGLKFLDAKSRDRRADESAETRNIVVFDDKNIFRVGAEAGADRQRMKFGTEELTEAAPELRDREGGRVVDLVVNGKVVRSFELVSPGLWNAFKGDARDNLLNNEGPTRKREEAQDALDKELWTYKERAPLNGVERGVLQRLESGDINTLGSSDVTQLRPSFVALLQHGRFSTDTTLRPDVVADLNGLDAAGRKNLERFAPDWMLGKADRPAQPEFTGIPRTGPAPRARGMKFGKNAPEGINQATRAQPRGTRLNNINRLPKQVQQPANIIAGTLSDTGGKFLDKVMFTSDLVKRATSLGLKSADNLLRSLSARDFATREEERAIEAVLDLYADVPQAERGTGDGSVNRFIFDSTRTGKWGYGPKADPEMKARFNLLSEKSQKLVEAMFTHGDRMLARKKSVVIDNTTSVFDAQIAAAQTDKEKAELRTAKKLSLKRYESLFAITEGRPYAPIKRNGNYVVIAKSPKYLAAEAAGDTKALEKLQASGDDYHVSFVDGKNAGRTLMQQLQDQGGFGDVQLAERDTVTDELFSNEGALQQLSKLRTNVDNRVKAGEKESGPLLNIINQMYLDALAEGSARKSEMKRRGVDGEVDMIASFGTQGRADANFLASLQYSEQVSKDLNRMREEAKTGDRTRKSEVLNEIVRRYSDSLEVPNTPVLDKLTRMSSVYFLATSPAYYLQNLTQPFMMSVPAMAGEHSYARANAELFKAYGELAPMMKSASLMKQLDFTKVPADVKNAINQLVNRGRVDIGIDTELGEFKVDGESRFGAAWNSVDKGLRAAVQKGEAINRLSTAIAAYRLAMSKKGATAEDAINYAERILLETHGDYSRFNAPRAFNTQFGRIALQFRKFQLIQLTWYAKMIKQAYSDPAQRGAALRSLAFGLAHTGVLAGAMGLPGYAAVAWALGAVFGDDDEAFDLTDEIRKLIGDDDLANMVLRGVPTLGGADVSGKIGAGNMLSIMPFSNADLTTRSGFYEGLGTLVAGASGGMVVRGVDGLGLLANGDYLKGMELVLPKGLGDMIKAYRLGTDGATRRNNDVILPADELDTMEVLFQALGIPPAQITAMYEKQQRVRDTEQRFRDRTSRIKNDYSQAIRKGDSASAAEARADWNKLQEARVRAGLKRQPLSNLLKAPREQSKRERETAGGVQFTRASRGMVEDIVER